MPVVILTHRATGRGRSERRRSPVENDGVYALVASLGGAPKNPVWYYNLKAHPGDVRIQDGPEVFDVDVPGSKGPSVTSGGSGRSRPIPLMPSTRPRLSVVSRSSWRLHGGN